MWNENRLLILILDYEIITNMLSSQKFQNGNQYVVWQFIHKWVTADLNNRFKYFFDLLKNYLNFEKLDKIFIENVIFKNDVLKTHFAELSDLKNFVENKISSYKQTNQILLNKKTNILFLSEIYNLNDCTKKQFNTQNQTEFLSKIYMDHANFKNVLFFLNSKININGNITQNG